MTAMKDNLKGKYRHFKGGIYEVVCVAMHSETLEEMVVYRNVSEPQKVWVRPISMWNETVECDGKTVKRFTKIESE